MLVCSDPAQQQPNPEGTDLERRLERGEIVTEIPFALPAAEDLTFLMQQRLRNAHHKNISYTPHQDAVTGFALTSPEQAARLQKLLREFSQQACLTLAKLLPNYAPAWRLDRASLRTEEEATRRLRLSARNDLLHFDAFPSRPTQGDRILRLYVNINPTDDRIWMTSDTFAKVLEKYGSQVGLPHSHSLTWVRQVGHGLLSLFQAPANERSEYDEFMLRLHHFLKNHDEFQDRAPKRLWHFKPGSAWLFFADGISHAELRGQYALEHSFFIAPHSLALPEESPLTLLERRCGRNFLTRVA